MKKFKLNHIYSQIPFWNFSKLKKAWMATGNSFSNVQSISCNGSLEQDVFCLCLHSSNEITIAEISQFIGGKSKKIKILNALKNLANTRYHLKNKGKNGEMKSLEFTLLSKLKEIGGGRNKKISFEIDTTVEHITSGHQWVSLDEYFTFSSGLPRRLFLFLEKRKNQHKDNPYEETIGKLCQWLPVNGRYTSDKKRTLKKALEELQNEDYISYKFSDSKVVITWTFAAAFLGQRVEEKKQIPEIDQVIKEPKEEPTPALEAKPEIVVDTTPAIEPKENIISPTNQNIQSAKTEKAAIMEKQEITVANVPQRSRLVDDLSNYECKKCHDYFGFLEKGICPRCRAKNAPKSTSPLHIIDVKQALVIAQQCRKPIEITSPQQNPKKDLLDGVRKRVKQKIEAAKNDDEAQKMLEEHRAKTLVDSLIRLSQREEFTNSDLTLLEKQELFWSKVKTWKPEDIDFWLSSNSYNFNISQLFNNSKFNNMEDFCNYFSRDFLKKVEGRAKKAGNGLVISLFKSGEKYELTDYEWECLDRGVYPDDGKVIPPDPEKAYQRTQQYIEQVSNQEDDKKRRRQIFIEKLREERDKIDFDDLEQDARRIGNQRAPLPFRENPDVLARYTKIAMVEILAQRLSVAVPESGIYPEIIKLLKTDLQLIAT